MRFGFRVDASIQLGSGHVMRCLTLADQLKKNGADVRFYCRDFHDEMNFVVKERGHKLIFLPTSGEKYTKALGEMPCDKWRSVIWKRDAEDTLHAMKGEECDWMIVDHYGIDFRWHARLRGVVEKIMVIDDLADRQLDCDLLLDQTFGREEESYRSLTPDWCELRLGSHYALIRPEFAKLRKSALEKRRKFAGIQRVLLFMGGSDPDNITGKVLDGIVRIPWENDIVVDVVLGRHAPHILEIKEQAINLPLNINVLTNVVNMAMLIFDADIAIGAGGISSWERCSLALPSFVTVLADNQQANANIMEKLGASMIWNNIEELQDGIANVNTFGDTWFDMCKATVNVCDGLGCKRIANRLIDNAAC